MQQNGAYTVKRFLVEGGKEWEENDKQDVIDIDADDYVPSRSEPKIKATTSLAKVVAATKRIYVNIISFGTQTHNSHVDVIDHFLGLGMDLSELVLVVINPHAFSIKAYRTGLRVKMMVETSVAPFAARNIVDTIPLTHIRKGKKAMMAASHSTPGRAIGYQETLELPEHHAIERDCKVHIFVLYNSVELFLKS